MTNDTNRREFVQAAGLAAGLMAAAAPVTAAAQPQAQPRTMGARFRALMNGPEPLICANAYDLMTARLIEAHGFKGVFVGSSATNQELVALPDQAIVTVGEIINYDIVIAQNVDIPIVADVDDFGATPLNVYRFAKQSERGGIACAAFDDRMPLNRATGYAVPGVLPKARMIDNIHAAADARTDMVLVARCLAPTPNKSYTEMLDRAAAYAEAGADLVWIGLPTPQDYVKAADMIKKPLFGVIGGANLPATAAAMKAARITVGQTGPVVNIALGAVDKALTELTATGRMVEAQKGSLNRAMSDKIEQVEELNARAAKYNLPKGSATER
ncbi:MAG TPA: isocitrate lyase/phosphoenolpyruvate mutase family protein [Micropepsaceae bacterium]|nr:isocitrate lyase/phosphoenolpyruvate mutase family protein [Micropepsaceae bacterium]